MSFVFQLWLPILVSAAVLFVLSAASHMALPWRRGEWGRISDAEQLQAALRGLAPGVYSFPAAPDQKQQMTKEWMDRWAKGPSGWLTVAPPGPMTMGRSMALSFLVFLGVAFMEAYVAWHALGAGARPGAVVRLVGTVGILAFGLGPIFNSIWYHRPWRTYLSDVIDAVLFGLALAAVFAWLWPG